MIKSATWAAGCVVLVLLIPQGGAFASSMTIVPESGTYLAETYVQSVSGSGCLDKAGYGFVASMSFAGLGGTTHYLRAVETGPSFAVDSLQELSVRSGKGTTSLSGDLTWTGAGIGGSWNLTGTFSATITEISTHAFVMALKETYSGCSSEDINVDLVRTGVNQ